MTTVIWLTTPLEQTKFLLTDHRMSSVLTHRLAKEGNVLFNNALNTFYLWLYCIRHMLTNYSDERNVLFNDALNTFYLRLYGVRHMVKDHSYSERGNPLPPHRLLLSINSKGSFICAIPQTG